MKNFARSASVLASFTGDIPLWERGRLSKDIPTDELIRLLLEVESHIGDCRRARKLLFKELNGRIS